MEYPIIMGDEPAGTAEVTREGLYYRIRCRVKLSGQVRCKILVNCGDMEDDLGLLVPVGDDFGLDTRIPVKRLGEGEMRFRVLPRHSELRGRFVPLSPEEPFRYISRIHEAILARKDGQVGLLLPE